MFRLFLVVVLLAVSLYALRLWRSRQAKSDNRTLGQNQKRLKMVSCEECGLHIPDNEAIKIGDKTFCSLEHAKPHN
ncbi:PP0621 family protein [Leucothrix mucor]|jgi:uncharacterized protein|uniref:PP0621 family protein n=1 Tax=Leucothrix mucor TaxID=45248 RepID=UPI003CCBF302